MLERWIARMWKDLVDRMANITQEACNAFFSKVGTGYINSLNAINEFHIEASGIHEMINPSLIIL